MAVAQQTSLPKSTAPSANSPSWSSPRDARVGATNILSATEASLRRVAIVLSSLPAHVANRLMAGLTNEAKQSLREAIQGLVDVDPLERHRAFQAFKGSLIDQRMAISGDPATSRLGGDTAGPTSRVFREADFDASQPLATSRTPAGSAASSAALPELAFLEDIEDDVLAKLIAGEHPQAIALVLASIAPAQAARIVTTLEPRLQSEALNRIARLDEASQDAIADLTDHLRAKAQRFGSGAMLHGGSANGKQALQAILAAMPRADAAAAPVSATTQRPTQEETLHEPSVESPQRVLSGDLAVTDEPAARPRLAAETWPQPAAQVATSMPKPTTPVQKMAPAPPESTDAIHQHLIKLPPQELCRALAMVDERQALLTLCGLPNHVAEKVLAVLPRGQAKQIRAKLSSLGGLQLREIDAAKELVALTSIGRGPGTATLPIQTSTTAPNTDTDTDNDNTSTPQRVPLAA